MFRSALVAISALAALVSAQQQLNYSTSGTLSINVSQIPSNTRQTWCLAETQSCPQLCGGISSNNTCDSNTLEFNCTCPTNPQPNISDYTQTIPYFTCITWVSNCVDNHPNDLIGITACRSVICGSQNASAVEAAASASAAGTASTTPTSTSGSGPSSTAGTGTTSATPSTSTSTPGAAIALSVAQNYGTGIMLTGLLAVFGLAL